MRALLIFAAITLCMVEPSDPEIPEDPEDYPTTCEECRTDSECEALCPMED